MDNNNFEVIPKHFASQTEELEYYKKRSHFYQRRYEDQRDQFDEYEEYSKNVESELDMELKQLEATNKDMKATLSRVLNENETMRGRMEQMNAEYNAQLAELTAEVTCFRKTSDEVNCYVRVLEQKNDDLERSNRAAAVSIEDFEKKLNEAIERNAFLESELDEKETLKGLVQRLKDETRDLQGELAIKRSTPGSTPNHHTNQPSTIPVPQQPDNKETYKSQATSQNETKNPRANPLSLVNNLLRQVGVLESKLATYNRDNSLRRKLHKDFIT